MAIADAYFVICKVGNLELDQRSTGIPVPGPGPVPGLEFSSRSRSRPNCKFGRDFDRDFVEIHGQNYDKIYRLRFTKFSVYTEFVENNIIRHTFLFEINFKKLHGFSILPDL